MIGLFKWKLGVPTKDGECLVMHKNHKGEIVIDHDFWHESIKNWQSEWRKPIAWCYFEDINTTSEPK